MDCRNFRRSPPRPLSSGDAHTFQDSKAAAASQYFSEKSARYLCTCNGAGLSARSPANRLRPHSSRIALFPPLPNNGTFFTVSQHLTHLSLTFTI
jgi:hypothetical protein